MIASVCIHFSVRRTPPYLANIGVHRACIGCVACALLMIADVCINFDRKRMYKLFVPPHHLHCFPSKTRYPLLSQKKNGIHSFPPKNEIHLLPTKKTISIGFHKKQDIHWLPPKNDIHLFPRKQNVHWLPPKKRYPLLSSKKKAISIGFLQKKNISMLLCRNCVACSGGRDPRF